MLHLLEAAAEASREAGPASVQVLRVVPPGNCGHSFPPLDRAALVRLREREPTPLSAPPSALPLPPSRSTDAGSDDDVLVAVGGGVRMDTALVAPTTPATPAATATATATPVHRGSTGGLSEPRGSTTDADFDIDDDSAPAAAAVVAGHTRRRRVAGARMSMIVAEMDQAMSPALPTATPFASPFPGRSSLRRGTAASGGVSPVAEAPPDLLPAPPGVTDERE